MSSLTQKATIVRNDMTVKIWHIHPYQEIINLGSQHNKQAMREKPLQISSLERSKDAKTIKNWNGKRRAKIIPYFPIIRYVNSYSHITIISVGPIQTAFELTEIF